jgi:predicted TIM-barrel enzyme
VSRTSAVAALRRTIDEGTPIVVAGVGSGLTAQGAVRGGADLLAVYSTAVYRIIGAPTALAFLPYDDANALTLTVAPQVLVAAGQTPVLVGLGAHDPRQPVERLLDTIEALGAAGTTNEPFVGIYGEQLRSELDAAGVGFGREVELVRQASGRGMLTLGWCFSARDVSEMCQAGADLIGAMAGITRGSGTPDDSSADARFAEMVEAARREKSDPIVLLHGGPLNDPEAVRAALGRTGADGYVTGSSAERQPVASAVAAAVAAFKARSTADTP